MMVTTSEQPTAGQVERAKHLADKLKLTYAHRGKITLKQLSEKWQCDRFVRVDREGYQLVGPRQAPFYFHPSMAYIRVQRMMQGDWSDGLCRASEAETGDHVLDCTMGLASDSIVFSYLTGQQGRVTALEAEPVIHAIVQEGLARYTTEEADINDAMRRIVCVQQDHQSYLQAQPDNSQDIVYFDPMFRKTDVASASMSPLRDIADHRPLSLAVVEEAQRVARKCVVMKESRYSKEFERLGFHRIIPSGKTAYGVIRL
ncbi:class I SAM-dependent methyltransferase [Marinicrinis sediminis]|uniref:Class I SAM-dependent methyltransferase n=1 Tax=Marinicrinis sediminis TaxID=1652465 RepID=A0ABW5REA3_9BACL